MASNTLTESIVSAFIAHMSKPQTKHQIKQKIIDPAINTINDKYYYYYVGIVVLLLTIIILLLIILKKMRNV